MFDAGPSQLAMSKVIRAHATRVDRVSIDGDTITTNAKGYKVKSSISQDFYEESIAKNGSTHSTSSDGTHTVVVNSDGFVRLYDNKNGKRLNSNKHSLMNAEWSVSNSGETIVGVSDNWVTVIEKGVTKELEQVDMVGVKGVVIDSKNDRFAVRRKIEPVKGVKRWEITLHDMQCNQTDVLYSGTKQAWIHFCCR